MNQKLANPIKMLALDMDGTTYFKLGTIVPQNVEPLQTAMAQGVEIVFITGRPVQARANALDSHGLVNDETIIAGYNGACIYELATKKPLKISPLTGEKAKAVFELVQKPRHEGAIIFAYVDDFENVISNANQPSSPLGKSAVYRSEMEFFDGRYHEYHEVKDQIEKYSFFKMIIFHGNETLFHEIANTVSLTVATSNHEDGEITAPGVDKAMALEWIAANKKVKQAEIMAIGDGANDLPMIEYAGYGVSLTNSIEPLKEVAQIHVPLSNVEGGVAYAINNYILNGAVVSTETIVSDYPREDK